MDIIFRLATLDDIENLIKIRFDFFKDENWTISSDGHKIIEESVRAYMKKEMGKNFYAVVADNGGELVSTAFLAITEKPANIFIINGRVGTIVNVFTYKKHRGNGYATNLLKMLIDIGKQQNLSYIELEATKMGQPIYEKLGFKEPAKDENAMKAMKLYL